MNVKWSLADRYEVGSDDGYELDRVEQRLGDGCKADRFEVDLGDRCGADRVEVSFPDGFELDRFEQLLVFIQSCIDRNLSIRTRIDLKFGTLALIASLVVSYRFCLDPDSD